VESRDTGTTPETSSSSFTGSSLAGTSAKASAAQTSDRTLLETAAKTSALPFIPSSSVATTLVESPRYVLPVSQPPRSDLLINESQQRNAESVSQPFRSDLTINESLQRTVKWGKSGHLNSFDLILKLFLVAF